MITGEKNRTKAAEINPFDNYYYKSTKEAQKCQGKFY